MSLVVREGREGIRKLCYVENVPARRAFPHSGCESKSLLKLRRIFTLAPNQNAEITRERLLRRLPQGRFGDYF